MQPKTIVIMDFDGTLYRGAFPSLCRGIANADLMALILFANLLRPSRFTKVLSAAGQLWRLERRLRRAYEARLLNLAEMDRRLIRFFARRVLPLCSPGTLEWSANLISHLCYPSAWRLFRELGGICDFVIVSKSFDFVLEKVGERAIARGLSFKIMGTQTSFDAKGWHLKTPMTGKHKKSRVRGLLQTGAYGSAVIIGDTEEDADMKDGALSVLDARNVVLIALRAKDECIAENANVSLPSWRSVGFYLRDLFSCWKSPIA